MFGFNIDVQTIPISRTRVVQYNGPYVSDQSGTVSTVVLGVFRVSAVIESFAFGVIFFPLTKRGKVNPLGV